jgi:hypothetical protein
MASDKRKEFLNVGILGGDAGVPERRAFRAIKTDYIGAPDYNSRFFETFPTVWASAYAFRKELAAEKQTEQGTVVVEDETTIATAEEWMSLFLLYYFGRIRLVEYKREALEKEYDKDLWLALSGTYPSAREGNLSSVLLLESNEGTVVGAYYPEVIFFPSRGRASWTRDETLQQFLVGSKLSWDLCRQNLLGADDRKTHEFHAHLELVARRLPGKIFKERVANFVRTNFHDRVDVTGLDDLDPDPSKWETPYNKPPGPEELLARYPLAIGNGDGGKNYYLVAGLPDEARTEWMKRAVVADAMPLHYRGQKDDKVISVQVRGKNVVCPLVDGKDHIIPLKDLFLADAPYWCKVGRANDVYTGKLRSVHRVDLRDPILKQDEFALCLAPIRREMLTHFPSLFQDIQFVTATPDLQHSRVTWTFHLNGYEVRWQTTPIVQSEMPNTSLALWPPKVSEKWRFYIAYGTGSEEKSGRWHLVDESGAQGNIVSLEEDVYVSVLPQIGRPNRPRGLLFTDNKGNERGVLFLIDLEKQNVDSDQKATLAVDFGTSNTCVAYKKGEATESEVFKFTLSPTMLWGPEPLENPGFVPFRWGGKKGFFPTIILSRRSAAQLEELKVDDMKVEDLFKVDIPGLHKDMEGWLVGGAANRFWEIHSNMKWDLDTVAPWRPLFLGLTLLYSHGEAFFRGQQGTVIDRYVFTFPLAFSDRERDGFHAEAKKVIGKIRQLCYGVDPDPEKIKYTKDMDESTAIARANRSSANPATLEVFIDVGGGTADIAIRNGSNFLVLDSIKVAGNTFFRFAKRNFDENMAGAPEFKKNLARLSGFAEARLDERRHEIELGLIYSLLVNRLDPDEFKKGEGSVLQNKMGKTSYQRYRTRLFFRHIIAYALVQACAAAVDNKLTPNQGIKLIMGGNAWGMMMFAELERSHVRLKEEAETILSLLKSQVRAELLEELRPYLNDLRIASVDLLNEEDLSKAKTAVALGALLKSETGSSSDKETARPYTGVTIRELDIVEGLPAATVRWHDRWGFSELRRKFNNEMDEIRSVNFQQPQELDKPYDPVLTIFTSLGNVGRNSQDNLPGETWSDVNSELCEYIFSLRGTDVGRAPINHFLSAILYPEDAHRDFLNVLAEVNGNYKNESK